MRKIIKIYKILIPNFFISFARTFCVCSVHSVSGSLGLPKLYPIIFNAAFTGIGLTSENKADTNGIAFI